MSDFERGPLQDYEVIWESGHVETVQAHQVILPMPPSFFGGHEDNQRRVTFHGEFDGHWMLVLSADADDIRSIRNVTRTEARP